MDTKEIKEAVWTKEEVAEHLRTNLTEKAGSYSAAVVVAALYKMLYGEFPRIGLSGAQAEYAEIVISKLPQSQVKAGVSEKKVDEFIDEIVGRAEYHLYRSSDIDIDRGKFKYYLVQAIVKLVEGER